MDMRYIASVAVSLPVPTFKTNADATQPMRYIKWPKKVLRNNGWVIHLVDRL